MSRNNVSQTIHNFIRSIVPGQEPHDSPQLPQPEVPANDAAVDAAPQPLTVQNVESMDIDVPPSSSQDDDNDSMPPLNDISESDESDEDFSQSDTSMDADELEVQLQAISDEQVSESGLQPPPQPPTSPNTPAASPSRSSTRRARVETDEDQDRDRRHPSQRVQVDNSTLVTANGPQPAQPLPRIHLPFRSGPGVPPGAAANPDTFRIWQHFMQGIPGPPNAAGAPPNNAQAPPAGQPQNGQAGHPMLGLFGITIDLGADPHVHAHPPPNPTPGQPLHPHQHMPPPMFNLPTGFVNVGDGNAFAELLARFGGMMGGPEYEQEDPERAKRLVNGLEEVPIGLIRRLERVGAVGSKDSDAVSGSGGDSDCAICWDRLLDGDGNQFGKEEESSKEDAPSSSDAAQSLPEASPATSSSTTEETLKHDSLSESKTFASSSPQPSHPKIVALPCAHVFHASCLIPWFSRPRQTTCPTCRFNVDPENLTYVRRRRTPRRAPAPANAPTASTATSNERMTPFVDADTPTAINTPATESVPPPPVNAGAGPATGIGGHGVDIPRNSIFTQALLNTLMGMQPTAAAGTGTGTAHAPTAPSEATPEQPGAPNPNAFTDALRNGRPLPQISAADLVNLFMAGYPPVSVGTNVPAQGPAPLNVLPNPTSGVATSQGATPSNDNDLPPLEPIDALLPDAAAPTANAQPAPAPGHQQGVPLNHGQRPDGQDEGFVTIGFDMIFGPAPGEGGADDVVMGDNIDLHGEFDLADAFEDHMNQFDQAMHGTPLPLPPDIHGPQPAPNPSQQNNAPSVQSNTHIHIHRPGHGPDGGMHITAGSGRTIAEALAQLNQHAQAQAAQPAGPQPEQANQQQHPQLPPLFHFMPPRFRGGAGNTAAGEPAAPSGPGSGAPPPPPQATPTGAHGNANTHGAGLPHFAQFLQGAGLPMGTMGTIPPFIIGGGANSRHQPRQPFETKKWTLPPAPGPTLRQRIERKEREAGLRCHDISCGIGPSDEDPFVTVSEKQVHIQHCDTKSGQSSVVCEHTFHPSCLVSAQRVALRGADENVEGEDVEVFCPVCRADGLISKEDWQEGVRALA